MPPSTSSPASHRAGHRFRGNRDSVSSAALVIVEDLDTGKVLGPLTHVVSSSPTGLNWGYAGAGARDLARSLLAAVLGGDAVCPDCSGRGGQGCCRDGLRADLPDTALVAQVIAHLGASWSLTEADLLTWWHHHQQRPTSMP